MRNTSCKLCRFATYEDVTQTGCSLGALDKMRERGVSVLECYDDDAEFYVLKNRVCPYYQPPGKPSAIVNPSHSLAIFTNGDLLSLRDTLISLDALLQSTSNPLLKELYIINTYKSTITSSNIKQLIEQYLADKTPTWYINNIMEDVHADKILRYTISCLISPIMTVIDAGYKFKDNLFELIDNFTMKELYIYGCVIPEVTLESKITKPVTYITSVFVNTYLTGDPNKSIIQNLIESDQKGLSTLAQEYVKCVYSWDEVRGVYESSH